MTTPKSNFAIDTSQVQVRIKQAIVNGVMSGEPKEKVLSECRKLIIEYAKTIADEYVRNDFAKILYKSAIRLYDAFLMQFSQVANSFGLAAMLVAGLYRGEKKALAAAERSGKPIGEQMSSVIDGIASRKGKAVGIEDEYTDYIFPDKIPVEDLRGKVKRTITQFAMSDTESGDGHNLRNRAEMFVRHEAQQNSIAAMRQAGVKLVWCSSHADCSVRCSPWQGQLYSLDGTSGTIDGHSYQPLENATNVFYTTHAGRTYKNGLLGFNCRHRLIPYDRHQAPPKVFSEMEMTQKRALDRRQRAMELAIRKVKTAAWVQTGQNKNVANSLFAQADKMTQKYRSFCEKNNLVALPFRTQVTREEIALAKSATS